MNVLMQIMRERRAAVADARKRVSLHDLLMEAEKRTHHSLVEQLSQAGTPRIVAEVKKASPSAGLLRAAYDPARIARGYEKAGAVGISVALQVAVVYLPMLNKAFSTTPIGAQEWVICIVMASFVLWVDEIRKLVQRAYLGRTASVTA